MQYSLRPRDEVTYRFNDFYKYIIGAQIPRGQGASVADLTFVYHEKGTYGILVEHLVYDDVSRPGTSDDGTAPGIVINEVLDDLETEMTLEFLDCCQPVPHMSPRSETRKIRDLQLLRSLGLEEWKPSFGPSCLGYFFSTEELRKRPGLIEVIPSEREIVTDLITTDSRARFTASGRCITSTSVSAMTRPTWRYVPGRGRRTANKSRDRAFVFYVPRSTRSSG